MENKESSSEKDEKTKLSTVAEIVKSVPVYQDVVQPSAKKIGESLETVTKAVTIALAPIKALVWGYDKIEEFITTRVTEKLKNVPKENITTPPPQVAGPAVEALRFSGHDSNLRELYANLLANAMDKETVYKAHPGFVEILKNLSSDEALLLKCFISKLYYPLIDINFRSKDTKKGFQTQYSNFSHICNSIKLERADLMPNYLNNLCRLGLLEVELNVLTEPNAYEPLINDKFVKNLKAKLLKDAKGTVEFNKKFIITTAFGQQFIENVVEEKG